MATGRSEWSSRRRVSISFAIAFSCGSDVPEQITKKSVNVEMSRKSSTTMSSAFLFEASSAQVFARFSGVISIAPDKVFHYELFSRPTRVRDNESIHFAQ